MALIDAAINNSVERSKGLIGSDQVFSLDTKLGTLEFDKAFEYLTPGDDHYRRVKGDAKSWFEKFQPINQGKRAQQVVLGDFWDQTQSISAQLMGAANTLYESVFRVVQYRIERVTMLVTAYCLLDESDVRHGRPDEIREEKIFRPLKETLHCTRLTVSTGIGPEARLEAAGSWTVMDAQHTEIKTIVIPVKSPDNTGPIERAILLFFVPPISPNPEREPYKIVEQDLIQNCMKELKDRGCDYLLIRCKEALAVFERADLVLYVPAQFPKLGMRLYSPDAQTVIVLGRKMTQNEILEHGPIPQGFRGLGWTAENVPPGKAVCVQFFKE